MNKIIITLILICMIIFIAGCKEFKEQELIIHETEHSGEIVIEYGADDYYIYLNCKFVSDNKDNEVIDFTSGVIELCKEVYPDLWYGWEKDNKLILLGPNPNLINTNGDYNEQNTNN